MSAKGVVIIRVRVNFLGQLDISSPDLNGEKYSEAVNSFRFSAVLLSSALRSKERTAKMISDRYFALKFIKSNPFVFI
jgi:hypothetical protein